MSQYIHGHSRNRRANPGAGAEYETIRLEIPPLGPRVAGFCLARALLLEGLPTLGGLPPKLRDTASAALLGRAFNPSKWGRVVRHLRMHWGSEEALLAAAGAPHPPRPGLAFLAGWLAEPIDRCPPRRHRPPLTHASCGEVAWCRDLGALVWTLGRRSGAIVSADREPDYSLRHLIHRDCLLFDEPGLLPAPL